MSQKGYEFFKHKSTDKIWWLDTSEEDGRFVFSFDREHLFVLFSDYPHKLTAEQKAIFDQENPFWANYFKDRQ